MQKYKFDLSTAKDRSTIKKKLVNMKKLNIEESPISKIGFNSVMT